MLKKFTAQNIDDQVYTVLDFGDTNKLIYDAKNGAIGPLKRLIQLMWASTAEDGVGLTMTLGGNNHMITSTPENIYFDNEKADLQYLEKIYNIPFLEYSKLFIITYTQLLNLELSRVSPGNYLNQYIFHKADSKSYYSPSEDIFYDIEQAIKYRSNDTQKGDIDADRIVFLQNRIMELESNPEVAVNNKLSTQDKIKNLENILQNQKKQDLLMMDKEQLENDIKQLEIKVDEYEKALSKVAKIDTDMTRYHNFIKLDARQVEREINIFTYKIREYEKMLSDIVNNRNIVSENKIQPISYFPLVIMIPFLFGASVTFAIIINILWGIIIGFGIFIFLILYVVFAQQKKPIDQLIFKQNNLESINNDLDLLKSAKSRYLNNIGFSTEDDYYASKALIKAMLYQKELDLAQIHQRFEGQELSDLQLRLLNKQKELNTLTETLQNLGQTLSPEDYIKKRRELDMLKLEINSSQNEELSMIDHKTELVKLKKELQALQNPQQGEIHEAAILDQYKQNLQKYYNQDNLDITTDFIINNINNYDYAMKVEMMIMQRISYIKAKYPNAELPLVMDDPFTGIDDLNFISKIIDYCSQFFQVILIAEHKKYNALGVKIINS